MMLCLALVLCDVVFMSPHSRVLAAGPGPENSDCLACHCDKQLTAKQGGKVVSRYIEEKRFKASIHGSLSCTSCHADLEGKELPHDAPLKKVNCGICHSEEQALHAKSLHGRALARGDSLAPRCSSCHGEHDIVAVKSKNSPVAPLVVPLLCGKCHREGSPVQKNGKITEHNILENYSESIHGEALLKKGLVVAANCASCHTAHSVLPPSDPASSIARGNIAATCSKCHSEIEQVHRKTINGKLWEKEAHVLPACVDCHQPHKVRKVYYEQGMADADCMRCHENEKLKSHDRRSMYVRADDVATSRHSRVACSQCHSDVNASRVRPCEAITQKVDCSKCHDAVGQQFLRSKHGESFAANKPDPNAPSCKECHGSHKVLGKHDPASPSYPTNVPTLCARCHREGEKAALRYSGTQHQITSQYSESIHGKGLLESGLTVTATCTNCHTAHGVLPASDAQSSVNSKNLSSTCGQCHRGIEMQFTNSVHSATVTKTDKQLPVCSDCHTAHGIVRADGDSFRLKIMGRCGRCHEDVAKSYFETYHGKVSQLGNSKTAQCYDCHGAHDILNVNDPNSHLSRQNVVKTCQKCHAGAGRRFAGYLTHATHHDPKKYPYLFVAFWGMTALLVGTFTVFGAHTILWIPRAFQMRREIREEEAREAEAEKNKERDHE